MPTRTVKNKDSGNAKSAGGQTHPRKKPKAEKALGEVEASAVESTAVRPFSDGIASVRLNRLVIVPKAGGEESTVLRAFLRHFQTSGCFVGNIATKMSFMKKGGRLL